MINSNQKVILVTGAARRIGAEIAQTLHDTGMNVVLHYRSSQNEAEALCTHLNAIRPNSAVTLTADLTKIEEIQRLVDQAARFWGRLDGLVNNASSFYRTLLGQVTLDAWQDLMDCNLRAPFFLSQAAAPYLKKQRGVIINIIDIHAERPMREYSVYCISKTGLVMLTKALARELSPDIRVNAISPGEIIWPEGENQLSEETKEAMIKRIALQRHGSPVDIARAVLFFIKEADYVTGQVLAVDGGRSLSS